jgi:hypothetical protein
MASNTSVVRNRITIDGRVYEAKALGGGKFQVVTSRGGTIGAFAVRGKVIEVEDGGIDGADPVDQIALLWAKATLSAQDWSTVRVPGAAPPAKAAVPPPAPPPAAAAPPPPRAPAPAPPPVPAQSPAPLPAPPIAPVIETSGVPHEPNESSQGGTPMTSASNPPLALESFPPGALDSDPRQDPNVTRGKSICRIATFARPEPAAFQRAKAYQAWLRTQPGVQAAYLAHDAHTGKTVSVTIWEDREKLAAMRHATPPPGAAQLKSLSVDLLWIVA